MRIPLFRRGPGLPRRLRPRFGLRALMALPLLAGVGLSLVDRFWVEYWGQQGTELIEIQVVDSLDGRTIAGAEVRLRGSRNQTSVTDAGGTVAFAQPYHYAGMSSPFRERLLSQSESGIDVLADGYAPASTKLSRHRRGQGREYALPYPIVIRLRPRPEPTR